MTKAIEKAKPLIKVVTYDKEVYFTDQPMRVFLETINNPENKFVILGGRGIAISSISSFDQHDGEGYEFLPKRERSIVERMIKHYNLTLGEYPPKKTIQNMIRKVCDEGYQGNGEPENEKPKPRNVSEEIKKLANSKSMPALSEQEQDELTEAQYQSDKIRMDREDAALNGVE